MTLISPNRPTTASKRSSAPGAPPKPAVISARSAGARATFARRAQASRQRRARASGGLAALAAVAAQRQAEVAVDFARIGLGDDEAMAARSGRRARHRTARSRRRRRSRRAGASRSRQPTIMALPTWLPPSVQNIGQAAGRPAVAPSQRRCRLLPGLEPEAVEQLSTAAPAGPSRIERARERDLLGLRRDLVEIAPATLAEARESRGEVLDAGLLRRRRRAGRSGNRSRPGSVRPGRLAEPEPEILERADRRGRQREVSAASAAAPPAPSSACRGARSSRHAPPGPARSCDRRATMNRRRKGNSVRPSGRLG